MNSEVNFDLLIFEVKALTDAVYKALASKLLGVVI